MHVARLAHARGQMDKVDKVDEWQRANQMYNPLNEESNAEKQDYVPKKERVEE